MSEFSPSYEGIKVNLITGFLGAGKTTLIKQLLTQIPEGERWAVLVNEFGEIGLDQTLLEAGLDSDFKAESPNQAKSVAIKQVAGGCVCCATSAAFQVALNNLIKAQNPDRILIEPTGLGHPRNILKQLTAAHYQSVLDIESSLCLLDARNLSDKRYVNHANFIEQVAMADILVASKCETYQEEDWHALDCYLSGLKPAKTQVEKMADGQLTLSQMKIKKHVLQDADDISARSKLSQKSTDPDTKHSLHNHSGHNHLEHSHLKHSHSDHSHSDHSPSENSASLHASEQTNNDFYFKASTDGLTMAWVFASDTFFDQALVETVLKKLHGMPNILRMKGVFNLESQALLLNATQRDFSIYLESKKQIDSKLELILSADDLGVQNQDEIQSWVLNLL
ncbi:cobalamin synthesis protein/P47K family protein [Marinomonas sp. MED121]|uniref:CobW family GTP-binding protein n=1 Tax=Marinomonas sp. MED121 TaxID=314277 RepID=UPI0000691005|nr:CobW family GTP-binding protein [Marinomonas sp. MED121]EAQ67279.1 cobalamin synthesis protein/P47K family protein [Marinomonas sp. MED121]